MSNLSLLDLQNYFRKTKDLPLDNAMNFLSLILHWYNFLLYNKWFEAFLQPYILLVKIYFKTIQLTS